MSQHTRLFARCHAFVQEQAAGEWDDKTIDADAEKLEAFVLAEVGATQAMREALQMLYAARNRPGSDAFIEGERLARTALQSTEPRK